MIWRVFAINFVLLMIFSISECKRYNNNNNHKSDWDEFQEFQEWRRWKLERERGRGDSDLIRRDHSKNHQYEQSQDPPPINEYALMARYIVNQADWTAVATISSRKDTQTFPFVNLVSYSDGLLGNGSGIPYMYLTPLDFTAQDLSKDHRATMLMTLAQGNFCHKKNWDPMDPRCARVVLAGKIKAMKNDSAELDVAKRAVFGRHPALQNMPADHQFFFAKLKIASIALLDTFGGPKYIPIKDYIYPPQSDETEGYLEGLAQKHHSRQHVEEPKFDWIPSPIIED